MRSPEAVGRESLADSLALDSTMFAEAAIRTLLATPVQPRTPTIAERAAQEAEFGGSPTRMEEAGGGVSVGTIWGDAVQRVNANTGRPEAAPAIPALPAREESL